MVFTKFTGEGKTSYIIGAWIARLIGIPIFIAYCFQVQADFTFLINHIDAFINNNGIFDTWKILTTIGIMGVWFIVAELLHFFIGLLIINSVK